MEYHDLTRPIAQERYPEVREAIRRDNIPLPAVAIDGELVMAGGLNFVQVIELVGASQRPPKAGTP